MLKILGVRPHSPRQMEYLQNGNMEIPFTVYLFNDELLSFDRGDDDCTLHFTKYLGQEAYCGFKFEIKTDDLQVLKIYTQFFDKWNKWVNDARGNNDINSFLSFLQSNKIPLVHYWDGMFYQRPETKCFRWFYNNRSQGRLFADSQIGALKRIQKRGAYNPESMEQIHVEEYQAFCPYQHLDIPTWIINNNPEH